MQRPSYTRDGGMLAMRPSEKRIERPGEYEAIGIDRHRDVTLGTLERFDGDLASEFGR